MDVQDLKPVKEYFKALAGVENALAGYYALCFEYWPEEELWGNLVGEEKRHSEIVLEMLAAVEARPENFTLLKPLNLRALSLFIEGLESSSLKVRSGAYRKLQAMSVSADFEKTITEARYDTLLKTGDTEYGARVDGLRQDTARHAGAFAERISKLRTAR
jgi:hypothetical protein